ncbi:uncharacterized protein LOC132714887 [Ruditapes philippinarum]|uniref:uncharacterized protein LOC132714887 n=1 Tax=Ruditapes philippinarum TaxID=129788 RepID=UPI00295B9766|nr:uncharacterized protein LOC132714887 [Ruditapes philippinarum]
MRSLQRRYAMTVISLLDVDQGRAHHGEWRLLYDDSDKITCELYCHHGYSISGCNVITKSANGHWSHDVPTCEEESSFFVSTLVKTSCKLANYAPMYVLEYMGFSKAGIVKKSIAAKLMKWLKTVKKNSLFAKIQSYMMKGAYPIEILDDICKNLAEYFSRKQNCEQKTEL